MYFFLIIVKSLQLRGRKQIAELRKYCLVCVIIFFYMSFFYFISHKFGNFVVIPYTTFTQAIVEDILRIKVGTLNTRDKLTWKENKPWEFMMKIAYQVAHRLSHPPSEEHSFAAQDQSLSKRLWSLNVLRRFKHLCGELAAMFYPQNPKSNLARWNVQVDSKCSLCSQQDETTEHIPWECPFARNVSFINLL